MKFQKELDAYITFVAQAQEQMAILKDRSDEAGAIELYDMFVAKRKEFLRLISADFRNTGKREIETEDVINIGSVDTSWLTLPEPKSVRVVE